MVRFGPDDAGVEVEQAAGLGGGERDQLLCRSDKKGWGLGLVGGPMAVARAVVSDALKRQARLVRLQY